MPDYYEILGVDRSANAIQIKAAYKLKAQAIHPDKGGGAEEFALLGEAYRVLADPQTRDRYDRGEDVHAKVNSPEVTARERLAMMFKDFITKVSESQDMIKLMRQSLTHGHAKMQDDIEKNNKAIALAEKMRGRMHFHGDPQLNVFENVINDMIAGARNGTANLEKELQISKLVLDMLDEYEIDVVQKPSYTATQYTTSTLGSGWHP